MYVYVCLKCTKGAGICVNMNEYDKLSRVLSLKKKRFYKSVIILFLFDPCDNVSYMFILHAKFVQRVIQIE